MGKILKRCIPTVASLFLCLFLSWSTATGEPDSTVKGLGGEVPAKDMIEVKDAGVVSPECRSPSNTKAPEEKKIIPAGPSDKRETVAEELEERKHPEVKSVEKTASPPKSDQNNAAVQPESGATKEPGKAQEKAVTRPPDRTWIMKMRPQGKKKPQKGMQEPIQWNTEEQNARCQVLLGPLKETFRKTRYYSIQGDNCSTAKHAKAFLELVEDCRGQCPENFLEKNGYTVTLIRNMSVLHELADKLCIDTKK